MPNTSTVADLLRLVGVLVLVIAAVLALVGAAGVITVLGLMAAGIAACFASLW